MSLLLPFLALGGLYIISNHEKEEDEENQREGFINEINNIPQSHPVKPIAVNYPKLKNIYFIKKVQAQIKDMDLWLIKATVKIQSIIIVEVKKIIKK